jgi:hypothetical protein
MLRRSKSRYRNAVVTSRDGGKTAGAERCNGRLYLTGLAVSVIGNNAMSLAAGIWVKSLTGTLVFFGPQAPLQAVGALAIRYATYQQLYLAGVAVAVATAIVFTWTCRQRSGPGSPAAATAANPANVQL